MTESFASMLRRWFSLPGALWQRFYEGEFTPKFRLYRYNPCDADAMPVLKLFGLALASMASHCPCCSAVRMVIWIAAAARWPDITRLVFFLWFVLALLWASYKHRNADLTSGESE